MKTEFEINNNVMKIVSHAFLVLAGISLAVLSDTLLAIFCLGMAIYTNIDAWNYQREMKE